MINPVFNSTPLIKQFIDRYQIWCDHQIFYNKKSRVKISHDISGIPCYHHNDIELINQEKSDIVGVDVMTEGWHCRIQFLKYRTDKKYIFFINGFWDTEKKHLPYRYKIVDTSFFLFEMVDTYFSPHRFCFYSNKTYNFDLDKPMMFVSTVGNTRPIRDYLTKQLVSKLNYSNYILKYSGQDLGKFSGDLDIISVRPGEFDPYISLQSKYFHTISQTLPIAMYNQARFNLIVETDIEETNQFFLTEKTIKCLITGMPFVVVASPKFLSNLHDLGFVTYNDIWDESYDEIQDHKKRVDSIIELCNHLACLDWQKLNSKLRYIGSMNQLNFMNLNNIADKIFSNFEKVVSHDPDFYISQR
jgi:hypothetical protein